MPDEGSLVFLAFRLQFIRIFFKADLIVGTVPNLREHVVEVSQSEKPVVCVPQGIEPALLLPPDPLDDEYARTNFPDGKFIVCYAGTIGAANALDTLIACATEMADRPRAS